SSPRPSLTAFLLRLRLLLGLLFLFLFGGLLFLFWRGLLLFLGSRPGFLFRRRLLRLRFGLPLGFRRLRLGRRRFHRPRSRRGFLRFRRGLLLDLRLDQLVADQDVLALDDKGLFLRLVDLRVSDGLVPTECGGLGVDHDDVLRRLEFLREERPERIPGRGWFGLVDRLERDLGPLEERILLPLDHFEFHRHRSIRRRTSRTRDFAASSARTTTTPCVGRPYSTAVDEGARAMQTRARRSSSPRTSTRTRSFDLKPSDTTRHASGVIVPAGFVTRITAEPIRWRASRSSGSSWRFVLKSTRHTSGERPRATR